MLEQEDQAELPPAQLQRIPPTRAPQGDKKQRNIMLLALALLVVALALVIVKNWDFWFAPSSSPITADTPQTTSPPQSAQNQTPPFSANTSTSASQHVAKAKSLKTAPPRAQGDPNAVEPIITNRTVLPPLEVEVVAGNAQHPVQAKNNSIKVEMQSGVPPTTPSPTPSAAPQGEAPVVNAAEQVRLSPSTVKAVSKPVQPNYPVLAKQMKVQGSVILQALIGKNGAIQDLRVLSGPSILSTAALEAVKQWHFKPYYQDGVPVDTEARVTVNFTISTY